MKPYTIESVYVLTCDCPPRVFCWLWLVVRQEVRSSSDTKRRLFVVYKPPNLLLSKPKPYSTLGNPAPRTRKRMSPWVSEDNPYSDQRQELSLLSRKHLTFTHDEWNPARSGLKHSIRCTKDLGVLTLGLISSRAPFCCR